MNRNAVINAQVFERQQVHKRRLEFGDPLILVRVESLGEGVRPAEGFQLLKQPTACLVEASVQSRLMTRLCSEELTWTVS